ncbi:hypothetical protein HY637_01285 [Candidatus Woesearchaeota archaeon]|nr:hypothetical protein [Candidatus Woesearchaeota archaeon]
MQKTKKQGFLTWNYEILKTSFKNINQDILFIIILDFLFYIASGYLVILWITRITEKINSINLQPDFSPAAIQQLSKDTQMFYYVVVFSFVMLLVAIIFLASILKGIIWAKTIKAKISLKLLSKFLGLNLVWLGFWFAVFFLISWIVEIDFALQFMAAAALAAFYLTNILYSLFMSDPGIKSVKQSIKIGIAKIHLFLLPYALIFLGLYLVMFLSSLTRLDNFSVSLAHNIYKALGLNFAPSADLAWGSGQSPELTIALLAGLLANPLLLMFVAFARYYVSALASGLSKP